MTNAETKLISESLIPIDGTISGVNNVYSITIKLQPFYVDNEEINESLIIDDVDFSQERIEGLTHKKFIFPANPESGYVETSIYIWSVHNPIDILAIQFGDIIDGKIETYFETRFVFEFEGRGKNLDKTFTIMLRII